MAVTRETLRLLDGMRVSIGKHVDDVTRDLVRAWARAWDVLAASWSQAIEDVLASIEAGAGWPDQGTIERLDRVQRALAVTRAQVLQLGDLAGVTVVQLLPTITGQAIDWHRALIDSQLPTPAQTRGITSAVSVTFNRVDPHSIDAIVRRTTEDIASYLRPLSAQAGEAMRRRLVEGIAVGDNPRAAAARMLADVKGEFAGGLSRALNISRTEMLDAHRAATMAADRANPDLITGWTWMATLDERTCPSCWCLHGSEHKADEQGPDDHQSGRCTRLSTTRPWSELGFDIPEPPPLIADAEATFYSLPESKQLQIMGPGRLAALKAGTPWESLTVKRSATQWRDSQAVRPVRDLIPAR